MIPVTQLRQGVTFLFEGNPTKVITYAHTHMGRGGGTIRVRVKNLNTGSITERTFKNNDRVEDIDVSKKQMQFLYQDGEDLVFMDENTFDQMTVPLDVIGADRAAYLKEGEVAWLQVWNTEDAEKVLDIDLPASVIMTVIQADPGEKGNSASNVYKDGILENGVKVRIPLFVNEGEKIKVSTDDGSYLERA